MQFDLSSFPFFHCSSSRLFARQHPAQVNDARMATSVASRNPSPVPRSRPRSNHPPPPSRSSSQIAAPTLSRLTTRSSSATRLYNRDVLSPTVATLGPGGFQSDARTSLNSRRDKHLEPTRTGSTDRKSRKGKAVAFVVGINSSSEEGDSGLVDAVPPADRGYAARVGVESATGHRDDEQCTLSEIEPAHAEPGVKEIIRSQVRRYRDRLAPRANCGL